jgi:drug/metabolite transporter (DMT)-like permease
MSETRRQRQAIVVLMLVTLFWGVSFPWVRSWMEASVPPEDAGLKETATSPPLKPRALVASCPGGVVLTSLTLIALRMVLALALLAAWHRRGFTAATWREHGCGALVGVFFGVGFLLQVIGLATTTPALSAFFTSLACGWTPLLAWAVLGMRPKLLTLLGLGVALGGTAVLTGENWQLGVGEWLTIVASLLFAGQILLVDQLGRRVRADHITVGFFGSVAVMSLAGALPLVAQAGFGACVTWLGQMLQDRDVLLTLLALAILPTALSFHLMNVYQPQLPAHRAALIYLLEPVFAAIFSVFLGYDRVTVLLLLGGGLILVGNLLVELPALLRVRVIDDAEPV